MRAKRYWRIGLLLVVVGVAAWQMAIFAAGKKDRLIEANLMVLQGAIDNYATDHKRLPGSLKQLDVSRDIHRGVRTMLSETDVTYMPNARPSTKSGPATTHYYRLCATFTRAKTGAGGKDFSAYLYPLGHPAGRHCYMLKTTTFMV